MFFFAEKEYTDILFNDEVKRVLLILVFMLLVICFFVKIFITSSVKSVFKRKYLNKFNVYIYDVYIIIVNIACYSGISLVYFNIINKYYDKLSKWKEIGTIASDTNIDIFNYLKYGIVVIIAIFIALNSLKCLSIVHKNNKFVFEEEM